MISHCSCPTSTEASIGAEEMEDRRVMSLGEGRPKWKSMCIEVRAGNDGRWMGGAVASSGVSVKLSVSFLYFDDMHMPHTIERELHDNIGREREEPLNVCDLNPSHVNAEVARGELTFGENACDFVHVIKQFY